MKQDGYSRSIRSGGAPSAHTKLVALGVDPAIRMPTAMAISGLGESQLFLMISRGEFPRPFKLTPRGRAVGWRLSTITGWLADRESAS